MPNFPIVDAHLHLWDPTHFRMSWLDGNAILNKSYGLAEYRQHTRGVEIAAMVYLQVAVDDAYGLLEAQWAADRAREDDRIQAIVPWAPLEYGEQCRAYLDALVPISSRIKGVRRLIQDEPRDDFCVQPRFVRGVQILADYGLSFDLCVYHRHLPNAIRLVSQCPKVSFILDHIGKPSIKDRVLDPWRSHIRELAAFSNVSCKLSGMVTEADHQGWTPADLAPYVDQVIESFGEDRIVFGGDWPVAFQASTYPRWVETLDGLTTNRSDGARRKLWSENARRFYRIAGG